MSIKTIAPVNIRLHFPLLETAVAYLILDRFSAAGWVWGVVGTIYLIYWILWIVGFFAYDSVDVIKEIEELKNKIEKI